MRFFFILAFVGFSIGCSAYVKADSSKAGEGATALSELKGFMDLELRDCISAYDAAIFQVKSGEVDWSDQAVSDVKKVLALMHTALNEKVGRDLPIAEVRETSSFHISGIYLASNGEHLAYQERIMESCNAQISRIAAQVTLEVAQK